MPGTFLWRLSIDALRGSKLGFTLKKLFYVRLKWSAEKGQEGGGRWGAEKNMLMLPLKGTVCIHFNRNSVYDFPGLLEVASVRVGPSVINYKFLIPSYFTNQTPRFFIFDIVCGWFLLLKTARKKTIFSVKDGSKRAYAHISLVAGGYVKCNTDSAWKPIPRSG